MWWRIWECESARTLGKSGEWQRRHSNFPPSLVSPSPPPTAETAGGPAPPTVPVEAPYSDCRGHVELLRPRGAHGRPELGVSEVLLCHLQGLNSGGGMGVAVVQKLFEPRAGARESIPLEPPPPAVKTSGAPSGLGDLLSVQSQPPGRMVEEGETAVTLPVDNRLERTLGVRCRSRRRGRVGPSCAHVKARARPRNGDPNCHLPAPLAWVRRLLNPVGRGELTNTFFIKCMENWEPDWSLLAPFSPTAGRHYARLRVRGP
jgi:hypothetical protein